MASILSILLAFFFLLSNNINESVDVKVIVFYEPLPYVPLHSF